jgi:hypothetical protein
VDIPVLEISAEVIRPAKAWDGEFSGDILRMEIAGILFANMEEQQLVPVDWHPLETLYCVSCGDDRASAIAVQPHYHVLAGADVVSKVILQRN